MNYFRFTIAHGVACLSFAASLIATSAPALSEPNVEGNPAATEAVAPITQEVATPSQETVPSQDNPGSQGGMAERIQAQLQQMAYRLQIDPAQQDAWNAYRGVVESLFENTPAQPIPDTAASTLERHRAELAMKHAQKLTQLAEATAKLEEVLKPEQRSTLNEIVRERDNKFEEDNIGISTPPQ